MKSYIQRAKKFLGQIYPYIKDDLSYTHYLEDNISKFSKKFHRKINIMSGSARVALITSDYVIKWTYDNEAEQEIGGNQSELEMYKIAKNDGYEYLLAEPTEIYIGYTSFLIMPKINYIGNLDYNNHAKKSIENYTSAEEYNWITNYINDLHCYNWGFDKNNNPKIVDYGMNSFFEPTYSNSEEYAHDS